MKEFEKLEENLSAAVSWNSLAIFLFLLFLLLVFFEAICFSLGVTGGWSLGLQDWRSRQNRARPATGIVGLLTRLGLTQAPTEGGTLQHWGPDHPLPGSVVPLQPATLFCTLFCTDIKAGNVNFELMRNLNCVSGVVSAVAGR